jgi:uncharacterized metal-binding protein
LNKQECKQKVFIIPCSGIGKSLGTVGRKATYKVIEELRPNQTITTCLALLTIGDEEALKMVRENPCVSIDGCPLQCSKKNIEASKGRLVRSIMVTDVLRKHRGLKPEGVITLNNEGEKLASYLADEVIKEVDKIDGDDQ